MADFDEVLEDLGNEGIDAAVRKVQRANAEQDVSRTVEDKGLTASQAHDLLESELLDGEYGHAADVYREIRNTIHDGLEKLGFIGKERPLQSPGELKNTIDGLHKQQKAARDQLSVPEEAPAPKRSASLLDYYDF